MNADERYFRETLIRKVDPRDVHVLAEKLDLLGQGDGGKILMGIIPKDQDQAELKYKQSEIFHIQKAAEGSGGQRLFTEILFEEWGSSGQKQPNIGFLLELLVEAELWQGADYVAEEWLNESPPARPSVGPAAPIPPDLIEKELNPLRSILFDSSNYPETNEINFNANHLSDSMIMGNNVDRFEKYQRIEKAMNFGHSDLATNTTEAPKPPPRQRTARRQQLQQQQLLSQQSANQMITTNTEDVNKVSEDDNARQPVYQENHHHEQCPTTSEPFDSDCFTLPKFSSLMQNSANTESTNLSGTSSIPPINREQAISMSNSKEITTATSDSENAAADVTTARSTTEIIPNLPMISGLNANSERDINCMAEAGRSNSANSSSSHNSSFSNQDPNDENLIEMCDLTGNNEEEQEEEEDGYDNDSPLPNLSNFDQHSSNNDSSLTTVTGTSGSNSFELSTNDSNSGSGSESGNIPCLSAFKQ